MKLQLPRSVHVPLAVAGAGVIAIIFLTLVHGPVVSWSTDAYQKLERTVFRPDTIEEPAITSASRDTSRCAHCGIVESTNRIAPVGNKPAVYEITVRLADRSKRVFSETAAPRWRPGERIVLIEGEASSQE